MKHMHLSDLPEKVQERISELLGPVKSGLLGQNGFVLIC